MSTLEEATARLVACASTRRRTGNRKVCLIVWCVEDVQQVCREHGTRIGVKQAEEVLDLVENHWSAEEGVSWDTLWYYADRVLAGL